MPEPDLIELFVARLDEIGAHYLVTGSVAETLYVERRTTHDIDLVVQLPAEHLEALPAVFPADEFYAPPAEVFLGSPKHLRGVCCMLAVSPELIETRTDRGAHRSREAHPPNKSEGTRQ